MPDPLDRPDELLTGPPFPAPEPNVAVALAYPAGWILCSTMPLIRYRRNPLVRNTGPDKMSCRGEQKPDGGTVRPGYRTDLHEQQFPI